jgi:putative ABC transport system ATP-binding protein
MKEALPWNTDTGETSFLMAIDTQTPSPSPAAQAKEPVVSAIDIHRRFGEGDAAVDALKGVSVDFAERTFNAVMGPSGSGKSTLMHILAGLDKPTSGSAFIAGTEITTLGDKPLTLLRREKVGFIFQFFNLLPTLTAEENITLPLRIGGKKVDEAFLEQLLQTMELSDRRKHRPSELSGGQQQRVAIARALMTRPAVVFADEPTGNLDTATSDHVLQLMRNAVDTLGQTIVMVTHDARAATSADRIVLLVDGKIVRDQGRSSIDQIFEMLKVAERPSLTSD